MRFAIESWAPEYGTPIPDGDGAQETSADVDAGVETAIEEWQPMDAGEVTEPATVAFVDGVRRVDARVWMEAGATARAGICASLAAGVVVCGRRAEVRATRIERVVLAPAPLETIVTGHGSYAPVVTSGDDPELLNRELQHRMALLERAVAAETGAAGALVLDGPLTGRENIAGAIGYVKTHRTTYLPERGQSVVAALRAGQRTPLFLMQTTWARFSWYLRLPGGSGHPWAGIVRCEVATGRPVGEVRRIADLTARILPRFASQEHREPRAPQNLYPIAGLENELRRRLGDRDLLYRALRRSAGRSAGAAGAPEGVASR